MITHHQRSSEFVDYQPNKVTPAPLQALQDAVTAIAMTITTIEGRRNDNNSSSSKR